jgi:dienelactone hydrolase
MTSRPFALQDHLDTLNAGSPMRLAFHAHSVPEFREWQETLRTELRKQLSLDGRPDLPITAEVLQSIDRNGYAEEKVKLDSSEGVQTPMYVLIPGQTDARKCVLIFPGHEPVSRYGVRGIDSPNTGSPLREVENDLARQLVHKGFLVGVVEQRGLGERLTDQVQVGPPPRSCRHLAFSYLLQGRTLQGERCQDGSLAAAYLLSRTGYPPGSLACIGHSAGGATALWLSAIDERIHAVIISGYFGSFRESILALEHCECNYVPGILELAEMKDLACLVGPRPVCILHGSQDPIFPVSAARQGFASVQKAYDLHGAGDACTLFIHPGGHVLHHEMIHGWLTRNV